jgi:hypothetical protein
MQVGSPASSLALPYPCRMKRQRVKLPGSWAPTIYGVIQSAVTTALATAIATFHIAGLHLSAVFGWLTAWAIAWSTMLPIVILVSPLIRKAVDAMTDQPKI